MICEDKKHEYRIEPLTDPLMLEGYNQQIRCSKCDVVIYLNPGDTILWPSKVIGESIEGQDYVYEPKEPA